MKKVMNLKKLISFSLLLIILSCIVSAESKYTREKSEELKDLIHWKEYSPETFDLAIKEQKPIYFVLSAPAWCYWCHVYESEDYLFQKDLYPYINEHFIPIFVDADKRPDLVRKYLEGGWPSTTIFTPNMQRIEGFTGPRDPVGLLEYLESVVVFISNQEFTFEQLGITYEKEEAVIPSQQSLDQIEPAILAFVKERYDPVYGGIGLGDLPEWREGQKFPQTLGYDFLLEQFELNQNKEYLDIVTFTFENQYTSNELNPYRLYDPIEGGFHRYSTKRDWTIPHYEKMLYDQAKFLIALAHYESISSSKITKEMFEGTISFVMDKMYDMDGGFYSSQDAHLEGEYFEQSQEIRETLEQPYIDKTKNIDLNGMMISSLLYVNSVSENNFDEQIRKTLDFMENEMVGKEGSFYYFDYEKEESFLTGQTLANSYGLLAFIEGYEHFEDESYLKTAEKIGKYSLDNLFDWNSGGFFERNSKDTEFYAPNERVDLSKPYEENGVFAYGMLKLYLATDNLEYLDAGMKTLGWTMVRLGGLDQSYYVVEAAQIVKENNLIEVYKNNLEEINGLVEKRKKSFFVNDLLDQETNTINLENVPQLGSEFANVGFIILLILAFFAGLLSFISPCTLPVLTAYFAQNVHAKRGEILKNTLLFFLGLAIVFSIFGMGATFLGSLFREYRFAFTKIAGGIIILLGVMQLTGKGFSGLNLKINHKKYNYGSFLFGAVFAIGWSACIGPILASLLLLSATTETIFKGTVLLFIYAIGLALPLILISMWFDRIKNVKFWKIVQGKMISLKIGKDTWHLHSTYIVSGIILIIIGILIFQDYLFALNNLTLQSNWVQEIIVKGEELIKQLLLS